MEKYLAELLAYMIWSSIVLHFSSSSFHFLPQVFTFLDLLFDSLCNFSITTYSYSSQLFFFSKFQLQVGKKKKTREVITVLILEMINGKALPMSRGLRRNNMSLRFCKVWRHQLGGKPVKGQASVSFTQKIP